MITATNEKENIFSNDVNTINQSLGSNIFRESSNRDTYNAYNTKQTSESISDGITFFDRNTGALICNDIGNKAYDNIYTNAINDYKNLVGEQNFNKDSEGFLTYLKEQLSEFENIEGYAIIDFSMNIDTGYQGGIYYNETTVSCTRRT